MYFAFDLWSSVAASLVAAIGLSLDDDSVSTPASGVLCGIAFVRLLTVVALRPLSVTSSNLVAASLELMSAVSTALGCVDTDGGDAATWLAVAQTFLLAISGLLGLSNRLWSACRGQANSNASTERTQEIRPRKASSRETSRRDAVPSLDGSMSLQRGPSIPDLENKALAELVARICADNYWKGCSPPNTAERRIA